METQNKFAEIIKGSTPVLVDFFAEWCGPCKTMGPILRAVKHRLGEKIKVLKVDVDKNPKAARAYSVQGVPTLIIFKNGEIKWRQSGVVNTPELEQVLSQLL